MLAIASDMSAKKQGKFRFQDFEVDLARRSLQRDGHTIAVGPRTFDLLAFLVRNPQRVLSKEELMRALWPELEVEESNLSQHIFLLRKALTGALSGDRLILTLPGGGYQFTPSVTEIPLPEDPPPAAADPHSEAPVAERAPRRIEFTPRDSGPGSFENDSSDDPPPRHPVLQFFAGFRHPGPWHAFALTATLAMLGFGGLFAWRWTHRDRPQSLRLVVADFDNSTGNPLFDQSLRTAVTLDFQQSPFLAVESARKPGQTPAEEQASAANPFPPELARQTCARLHDQAWVTGSIRAFAQRYLVTLRAFDCASGRSLAASKGIAKSPDGVVAVLDKVAADLRLQLGESPASVAQFRKPLFADRAPSLEALKAFAEASRLGRQGKLDDAATLFGRAVELDPQFALAFASLGAVYTDLGQPDLAKNSLASAYNLRDSAGESDRLSILDLYDTLVTGDLLAAIRNARAWTQEYPRNPYPRVHLADLETQIGDPALALEPAKRALELDPDNARAFPVLARAQLQLGQFEDAAKTCQLALDRQLATEQIRAFLLQIAFLRLDQPAIDQQIAAAKGTPAEPFLLYEQGLIDFAAGKAKSAAAEFAAAAQTYRNQGQNDRADQILSQMPRIQAELGLTQAAQAQLTRLPPIAGAADVPVAWAHVGETARAEAMRTTALDAHPDATLWQEDFGPQIQAAIALNQHRPQDAVDALQPALPYDLRSFDVPGMRGRAYLAARQPQLAEAEFHKILDHPGIEPLSHNYPLAQLGLARALAQQGKTVEAGFAYNVVLQIWKDADPDLPRLKEARAEYAHLTGESPKPASAAAKPTPAKPRRK